MLNSILGSVSTTPIFVIALSIGLMAAVLGSIGRAIQGGQLLKEVPGYRAIVTALYVAPILMLIVLWGYANWPLFSEPLDYLLIGGSIAILFACHLRPHFGPDHGKSLDMGTVEGTLLEDYLRMFLRFVIPAVIIVVANFFILTGSSSEFYWCHLAILVSAAMPATTYLIGYVIKWNVSESFQSTVFAEYVYPIFYSGGTLFALSYGMMGSS